MKKILVLTIIIIFIFAAAFAYIMLNKSAKGLSQAERDAALSNLLGRKLNLSDKVVQKDYVLHNGKYVSFIYPKDAKPFDEQNQPGGPYYSKDALENFTFSLQSPFLWGSIRVLPNTPGMSRLEDYSGIRVRRLDPNNYKESEITINGVKGLQYESINISSNTKKEAFFYLNNRIYFVLSEGNSKSDLVNLFEKVVGSLKFL